MIMITDALKIAIQKVFLSIVNIFVFRNVFSLTKQWLNGFIAFIATIFISNKIRSKGYEVYRKIKFKIFPEWEKFEIKFDKTKIDSISLINNQNNIELIECFIKTEKKCFQNDLFSYIFGSASQSAILNLIIIISIEYLNSKYFENIILSLVSCVGVAFVLCFGASFKYSSILSDEWSDLLQKLESEDIQNASHKSKKILIVYNREIGEEKKKEVVGLWWCQYDSHTKSIKVQLKFLSASYSDFLTEIVNHFVTEYVDGPTNEEAEESSLLTNNDHVQGFKNEKFEFLVPDYYDHGLVFSNALRKLGFKKQESWKEFKLFPSSLKMETSIKIPRARITVDYGSSDEDIEKYSQVKNFLEKFHVDELRGKMHSDILTVDMQQLPTMKDELLFKYREAPNDARERIRSINEKNVDEFQFVCDLPNNFKVVQIRAGNVLGRKKVSVKEYDFSIGTKFETKYHKDLVKALKDIFDNDLPKLIAFLMTHSFNFTQ
ncbi:hypothetical protein BpHYR1_020801 [Brachionus plicatilis]|uniref:Uncharacterized protein n=1 Tax=Brachionus plicatilis TaxID=10195 RepID=A0A3M7PV25_BRAPC|nr:hypothetical protein BpHYR1_020801 [Brachionus plicatilis]